MKEGEEKVKEMMKVKEEGEKKERKLDRQYYR